MCNFQLDKADKRIKGHSLTPKLRQKLEKEHRKIRVFRKQKVKILINSHKNNWTKLTS